VDEHELPSAGRLAFLPAAAERAGVAAAGLRQWSSVALSRYPLHRNGSLHCPNSLSDMGGLPEYWAYSNRAYVAAA
jgi:hypothetical protein